MLHARRRRISEGPGTFLEEPRAFYMRARHKDAFALSLCPHFAALSSARAGGMGESEPSYRLFSCRSCAQQVRICRRCDRGNQYCAEGCAREHRCESLRRAGARYQLSYRGACRHAARQRRWRARRAHKVTHQGSPEALDPLIVAASSIANDAGHAVTSPLLDSAPWAVARGVQSRARCSFCGRALPRFARWGFLRSAP